MALLAAGDREGYRRACTRLAQRGGPEDESSLRLLARTCSLAADALPDLEPLLRWAERAVEANPRLPALQETLGILLYRAGKFEPAVRHLEEAVRLAGADSRLRSRLFLVLRCSAWPAAGMPRRS